MSLAKIKKRGWVLYDWECPRCVSFAELLAGMMERRGFSLAPLQEPWIIERLGLPKNVSPQEIAVLTNDQKVFGGADALIYLTRFVWWAWPVYILSKVPVVMPALRIIYRHVAARRHFK